MQPEFTGKSKVSVSRIETRPQTSNCQQSAKKPAIKAGFLKKSKRKKKLDSQSTTTPAATGTTCSTESENKALASVDGAPIQIGSKCTLSSREIQGIVDRASAVFVSSSTHLFDVV